MSNRKLYVGNLSFSTTEDGLQDLFSQFGGVASVRLVTDRETGRSRGFAFVEMETDEQAKDVVSQLDGSEFEGRNLKVNEARPKPEGGGRGGYGGGRSFGGGGGGGRSFGGGGGGGRSFGNDDGFGGGGFGGGGGGRGGRDGGRGGRGGRDGGRGGRGGRGDRDRSGW